MLRVPPVAVQVGMVAFATLAVAAPAVVAAVAMLRAPEGQVAMARLPAVAAAEGVED